MPPMEPLSIILFFAILIPLLLLWVLAIVDIVRRSDLRIWKKGGWSIAVVLLPLVGVLAYAIFRPLPPPAGKERSTGGTIADQLQLVIDKHDGGGIDDEGFLAEKRALFGL